MLGTYRSNDVAIVIQQNNAQKRVDIVSMNENARQMLGYGNSMDGKPLSAILPERIAGLLNEYVEYSETGNDAATVLARISDFNLLDITGSTRPFFPKLIPADGTDGMTAFHLLLQPRAMPREGVQLRTAMQGLLPVTPAPLMRQQLIQQIEAWQQVENSERLPSAIGMLMIDQQSEILEWHGEKALRALLNHVVHNIRQKLRNYDHVLALEPHSLGLIMLDVEVDTVRLVLNRLRWETASLPVQLVNIGQISTTLTAAFAPLDMNSPPEAQLFECERLLTEGHRTAHNQLWAAAA